MQKSLSPLVLGLIALLLFALPSSAYALDVWAFVEINGSALPGVAGGNPLKDGGIPMSSFAFSVNRTISSTGFPQGASQKSAITLTTEVDGASPLLFRAVANAETVTTALFEFFRPNASTGQDELYYEIEIANGIFGSQNLLGGVGTEMEALKLYVQTLEQKHLIAGTSHID